VEEPKKNFPVEECVLNGILWNSRASNELKLFVLTMKLPTGLFILKLNTDKSAANAEVKETISVIQDSKLQVNRAVSWSIVSKIRRVFEELRM